MCCTLYMVSCASHTESHIDRNFQLFQYTAKSECADSQFATINMLNYRWNRLWALSQLAALNEYTSVARSLSRCLSSVFCTNFSRFFHNISLNRFDFRLNLNFFFQFLWRKLNFYFEFWIYFWIVSFWRIETVIRIVVFKKQVCFSKYFCTSFKMTSKNGIFKNVFVIGQLIPCCHEKNLKKL